MKCLACGKEGTKKDFLFDENKKAYCVNPFTCNEHHPNSVPNIIARGGAVKMFTEEELELNFFEIKHISEEMRERIMRVATKPQSIRLSKFEIAHYLLELQDKRGLSSISEAVRYCVLYTQKHMPIDAADEGLEVPPDESSDVFEEESIPAPVIEKSKGVKIIPATTSINVNWDEIDRQRIENPEPVKVEDEEDEF